MQTLIRSEFHDRTKKKISGHDKTKIGWTEIKSLIDSYTNQIRGEKNNAGKSGGV